MSYKSSVVPEYSRSDLALKGEQKYISDLWILSQKGVMFRKSTILINVILVERFSLLQSTKLLAWGF